MKNTLSRLEKRLARLLATTPRSARPSTGPARIDVVYLSEADQDRLDRCLRE
ncbi:hypothetical protein BJ993_005082 [Nocardioides aromaticivorans]|uniref:Uncharacterized protein n=1 Tax=Nocardioides aromaticivorans TaxID=200618 RepID=A0A7Y9ZQJ5_9ACTN|nr:hypothetical protein [Nocardioides aromaticivorans]NYI47936.1 hypothetical protein [Nocardioides aromaticivorans]